MPDTAHYALRLANGESLDSVLNDVWNEGNDASRGSGSQISPYAPSAGVK